MPMTVIYPQKDDSTSELVALLSLANMASQIADREQRRKFELANELALKSGTPHEQYELYDQLTGFWDWVTNSPMYQKKKHYEDMINKGNTALELYKTVKESPVKEPLTTKKLLDIATQIEQLGSSGYTDEELRGISGQKKEAEKKNVPTKLETGIKSALSEFDKDLLKDNKALEEARKATAKEYEEERADLQKQYSETEQEYDKIQEAKKEFVNILNNTPEVLLAMPEEYRNTAIDQYYKTMWNQTGSQTVAADAANALIKTINPRLARPIPYYDYMKVEKQAGGVSGEGKKQYKIIGMHNAPLLTEREYQSAQEKLADLEFSTETIIGGTDTKIDNEKLKKAIETNKNAIYKLTGRNAVTGFLADNDIIARDANLNEKLINHNMQLEKEGNKWRIWITSVGGEVQPTLISAEKYKENMENLITNQPQQQKKISGGDYVKKSVK